MVPYCWTETMTTIIKSVPEISTVTIPIQQDFHYLSLEPQQLAASERTIN